MLLGSEKGGTVISILALAHENSAVPCSDVPAVCLLRQETSGRDFLVFSFLKEFIGKLF